MISNIIIENTVFSPDVLSSIKKTTTLKAAEIGIDSLSSAYFSNILLPLTLYFSSIIKNKKTIILGFSGGQGSGKSSMTILLNHILNKYTSIKSLTLSIDDFYLSISERNVLAKNIHPMCKTRGVPGTHNIDKLIQTISLLTKNKNNKEVLLPAFSKVDDDYSPINEWRTYKGRPDIIFLEGWCIGAVPIKINNWLPPLNSIEKRLDPKGEWAKWSNRELGKRYQDLFSLIDLLIMIRLPSMEHVYESRWIQEKTLKKLNKGEKVSSKIKINEFVMHFERLTRHMFKTLPSYADLIIERDLDFNYVIK